MSATNEDELKTQCDKCGVLVGKPSSNQPPPVVPIKTNPDDKAKAPAAVVPAAEPEKKQEQVITTSINLLLQNRISGFNGILYSEGGDKCSDIYDIKMMCHCIESMIFNDAV